MILQNAMPAAWQERLHAEFAKPYWAKLEAFLQQERHNHTVYPAPAQVFAALEACAPNTLRVVLLGQDPYFNPNQAHGLAFSVPGGVPVPPSLRNIFKELETDLGIAPARHGNLRAWAAQGVLLLNTVFTVRSGAANSHKNQGWETFTDAIVATLGAQPQPLVFVLWGAQAQKKHALVNTTVHAVVQSAHPSPLSAHAGFFGSKPFSRINAALQTFGHAPVDWRLPPTP